LGHKGEIKATMEIFFNHAIKVSNVPGSDSKIDQGTRHKHAKRANCMQYGNTPNTPFGGQKMNHF